MNKVNKRVSTGLKRQSTKNNNTPCADFPEFRLLNSKQWKLGTLRFSSDNKRKIQPTTILHSLPDENKSEIWKRHARMVPISVYCLFKSVLPSRRNQSIDLFINADCKRALLFIFRERQSKIYVCSGWTRIGALRIIFFIFSNWFRGIY